MAPDETRRRHVIKFILLMRIDRHRRRCENRTQRLPARPHGDYVARHASSAADAVGHHRIKVDRSALFLPLNRYVIGAIYSIPFQRSFWKLFNDFNDFLIISVVKFVRWLTTWSLFVSGKQYNHIYGWIPVIVIIIIIIISFISGK